MKGDRDEAPIIGYGKDGPAFERLCPQCGRFLKMPKEFHWRERFDGICEFQKVECSKCGEIEPNHVGWAGDFH
jgi:hypothetical protein